MIDEIKVETVRQMKAEGATNREVAQAIETSISTVQKIMKEYGIKKATKFDYEYDSVFEGAKIPKNDGVPLFEQAKNILGERMREDWRGYYLDGRHVSSSTIVREAGLKFADET